MTRPTDDEADVPEPLCAACGGSGNDPWLGGQDGPLPCSTCSSVSVGDEPSLDAECEVCGDEGPLFRWYAENGDAMSVCEDCHGKSFAWLWDHFREDGCASCTGTPAGNTLWRCEGCEAVGVEPNSGGGHTISGEMPDNCGPVSLVGDLSARREARLPIDRPCIIEAWERHLTTELAVKDAEHRPHCNLKDFAIGYEAAEAAIRAPLEAEIERLLEAAANVLDYLEMAGPPCDNECLPGCVVCDLSALLVDHPTKDGD